MAFFHVFLATALVVTGVAPEATPDVEFVGETGFENLVVGVSAIPLVQESTLSTVASEEPEDVVGFIIRFAQDAMMDVPESESEVLDSTNDLLELAPTADSGLELVDALELAEDLYSVELTAPLAQDEANTIAKLLEDSSAIESVELDYLIKLDPPEFGGTSVGSPQPGAPWGLDRIDQRNLPLDSFYNFSWTGAGVIAYVVDTGVRSSHSEFKLGQGSRVVSGANFVNDGWGTSDCNGHGTHVAGTLGGQTFGVAKEVTIVPVRVLDCAGSGTTSSVVAGLNWIRVNHDRSKRAVVNLSLGGPTSIALDDAVNQLSAQGFPVVVASGNEGKNSCYYSPARATSAITVNASTQTDRRASFSNFGSCSDVYAPGVGIPSAWWTADNVGGTLSGTSMATPHVAGVVAQMLQATPDLTAPQVKSAIRTQATAVVVSGIKGDPNGLVNLPLLPMQSTPTPQIVGEARVGNLLSVSTVGWDEGVSLSHQWFDGLSPLPGKTGTTLTLGPEHLGKVISVRTTGTKSGFAPTTTVSAELRVERGIFTSKPEPILMGSAPLGIRSDQPVSADSSVVAGQVLRVSVDPWSPEATMTYQWLLDGRPIKKATRDTYVVSSRDARKRISVRVTGSRPGYESVTFVLGQTSPVVNALQSPAPIIEGSTVVGTELRAVLPDELTSVEAISYSYQWLANGKVIKRATRPTYALTSKNAGQRISVRVRATRSGYAAVTMTSEQTELVSR